MKAMVGLFAWLVIIIGVSIAASSWVPIFIFMSLPLICICAAAVSINKRVEIIVLHKIPDVQDQYGFNELVEKVEMKELN